MIIFEEERIKMSFITVFICFLCAILAYYRYKTLLNPESLFTGFVGFIVLLASFRLFGLTETSMYTHIVIIIGIVMFFVGGEIGSRIRVKNSSSISSGTNSVNVKLNNKLVLCLVILLLLFSLYRMYSTVLPMLRRGFSLDMIRLVYFGSEFQEFSYNRVETVMEMFVNLPFLYAMIPIFSIEITRPKDKKELSYITIILMGIWIGLSCVVSGGRLLIYNLAVCIGAAFLLNKREVNYSIVSTKSKKRRNFIIFTVLAIIIYMMYQLSINRTNNAAYEFGYQLYVYFCGCVPHTSYRLDTVRFDYTYGLTLISGFLRPVMLAYKYLVGNGNFPEVYQRTIDIGTTLQSAVVISHDHTYNAFVLPFYYFYFDGGLIGVLFDSFIYGAFCSSCFSSYQRNKNKLALARYLFVIVLIGTSMVRYNLGLVYFAFAFIYIRFVFKTIKEE